MKTRIPFILFLILSTLAFPDLVFSKTTKQKKADAANTKAKNSALTTDAKFGDQAVGGLYQLPMEALSVVENEKSIDDLIGVRKNFRDRVQRSKGMR